MDPTRWIERRKSCGEALSSVRIEHADLDCIAHCYPDHFADARWGAAVHTDGGALIRFA